MTQQVSRYFSPDGLLTFVVVADGTGDVTLGFAGYPWHTHADILAALSGTAPEAAGEQFVAALLGNKAAIAVATVAGRVEDVWVSDDPPVANPHKPFDEMIKFRFWDGTPWQSPAV